MKTKEFIKIMEGAGFHAGVADTNIRIRKEDASAYLTLAIVSETKRFSLGTQYDAFDRQNVEVKAFILDNLYRYASTPIADRTDIELNKYERMILESLHRDYKILRWSSNSDGLVVLRNGREYPFDMFEEMFSWVELDKQYRIKDLLNAE